MIRSIIVFIILSIMGYKAYSQQDPHFTQYMLNKSYWSPALTAQDGRGSLRILSRSQWLGYEPSIEQDGGQPSTQFFSFQTPITLKKLPLGVGANIVYDKQGVMNNLELQASIAYHKTLNRGVLSIGVRPTFINSTLDFSKLRFVDPADPKNIQVKESQSVMDLAIGISFSNEDYILAIGTNHLLRPELNYGIGNSNSVDNKTDLIYSFYGEYNYRLTYNIDLSPSFLAVSDLSTYSLDLSIIATYNKKLWGGLSYRNSEAMALIMGYSFMENNQLKAGYSFDYVINQQSAKQPTSHEIFIRYDLPTFSTGAKKIIRTPRFRY